MRLLSSIFETDLSVGLMNFGVRLFKRWRFPVWFIFILSCTERDSFQYVSFQGDEIRLIHEGTEGIPIFYKTEIEGKKIEFFLIMLEGDVRVFINRCRKCFNSGLGFSFEDKFVRCRTCNVMYPVKEISKGMGSCYPVPVQSRSDKRYCYIKRAELLKAISGP